jgi:hypothetical protein
MMPTMPLLRVFASRPFVIALCLIAAIAVIVTIGTSGKTRHSVAAKCSVDPPKAGRVREQSRYRARDAKQLIPGKPSELVACRYDGSESTEWKLRLRADIPVAHRDIARVVKATRVPLKPGDHGCMMEASLHQTVLIAAFADAPDLVAWVSDRCGVAGNGTLVGAFASPAAGKAILAALHRL